MERGKYFLGGFHAGKGASLFPKKISDKKTDPPLLLHVSFLLLLFGRHPATLTSGAAAPSLTLHNYSGRRSSPLCTSPPPTSQQWAATAPPPPPPTSSPSPQPETCQMTALPPPLLSARSILFPLPASLPPLLSSVHSAPTKGEVASRLRSVFQPERKREGGGLGL